ncbi:DUF4034 domain-containing protein [Gilvimarinus sp. SDUM040013]|uniref:DUF4034 domain-containing protein n=1 Tax=Gilvimarinus gilvus TaxID=3058038 RepID=A0ABU4S331_9GAMM|nr:DUF4034 domain-containing protein [Gilvimarinus sp. SDUM040013]MDO3387626.1 DUF4034 domain-containing protein [Gilvimarinus sp. SDUM040013]MDX6851565.1 DUF4034 domain-containing protein [Gilvimarinus sp. SDUM040013]
MNIPVDIAVYLVVMAALYFYTDKRDSNGFLWVVVYVVIHSVIHEVLGYDLIVSAVAIGVGLILTLEITRYYRDDPFSTPSLIRFLHRILSATNYLLLYIGVKPKTSFYSDKNSESFTKLLSHLSNEKWDSAEALLKAMSADQRHRVIDTLVDETGRSEYFDKWTLNKPGSAFAALTSGYQYVHWAWEARGSGTADTVTNDGIEKFLVRLSLARQAFLESIELDNDLVIPPEISRGQK